jgi:hypothetical protein
MINDKGRVVTGFMNSATRYTEEWNKQQNEHLESHTVFTLKIHMWNNSHVDEATTIK